MKTKKRLRTKGRFLNKKEWYSICSIHYEYDKTCNMCNAGQWVNVWGQKISSLFYSISKGAWIWWTNF